MSLIGLCYFKAGISTVFKRELLSEPRDQRCTEKHQITLKIPNNGIWIALNNNQGTYSFTMFAGEKQITARRRSNRPGNFQAKGL